MRLRQANRLVADLDRVLTADDIMSLEAAGRACQPGLLEQPWRVKSTW